jgi:hypothetical protein
MGLLVGSAILLALAGRWDRRDAFRLGLAGILALGLSLLAYHPKALSALAATVLSQDEEAAGSPASPPPDRFGSAVARARTFLGIPLIAGGAIGLAIGLGRLTRSPLRILFLAWGLSALVAYGLRYALTDLFLYQKELYWAAALLAVGVGALAATQKRQLAAGLAIGAALLVSYALELRVMVDQFFRDYLFL